MNTMHPIRRNLIVSLFTLLLPLITPVQVGAVTDTYFSATVAACSNEVNSYVVELEVTSLEPGFFYAAYPSRVLFQFEVGVSAFVSMSLDSTPSVKRYVLDDSSESYQQHDFLSASAELDVPDHATVRFQVMEYPCTPTTPTGTVSGVVRQHGSLKPIEGVTVCLQRMNFCGVTDVNGEFLLPYVVPPGEYELVSTGPKLRDESTTVIVDETQEYYEIIQRRGGGQ